MITTYYWHSKNNHNLKFMELKNSKNSKNLSKFQNSRVFYHMWMDVMYMTCKTKLWLMIQETKNKVVSIFWHESNYNNFMHC